MNSVASTPAAGVSKEERDEIVAVARDFADHQLSPRALQLDTGDAEAFEAAWAGVCEIGLQRSLLTEDAGGAGLACADMMAMLEQLATGDGGIALLTLLSNLAFSMLPADRITAAGESERIVLVPLPQAGTPGSASLKASERTASGRIQLALGGFDADGLVIVDGDPLSGRAFYVDTASVGVHIRRDDTQLGLRGAPAATIDFANTPILPLEDRNAAHAAHVLLRTGVAAIARGIARKAGDMAMEYAENRYQGGSMIIEHGAVRDMLALIAERDSTVIAAGSFEGFMIGEADSPAGRAALVRSIAANAAAGDAAVASTIDAVQVFGGMGYMHETGVEKLMRDAKYCQLFPRSNWLARDQLVELGRS